MKGTAARLRPLTHAAGAAVVGVRPAAARRGRGAEERRLWAVVGVDVDRYARREPEVRQLILADVVDAAQVVADADEIRFLGGGGVAQVGLRPRVDGGLAKAEQARDRDGNQYADDGDDG